MKRIIWTATLAALVVQVGCGGGKKDELADSASPKKVAVNPAPLVTDAKDLASKPTGRGAAPDSNAAADARDEMVPLSALNLANPTKPEEVVGAFLDGMRTGNAKVIEALLSTRARQEIKSKGLDIAPIGSPQAAFEIGKAQQIDPKDPNVMLVTSNWLEPGPKGAPVSEYEVVWALVKENDGWRICEMAVDTHIEGEEVQVVNFENL